MIGADWNAGLPLTAAGFDIEPRRSALSPHALDSDGDVRIFTVNLLGDLKHAKVPQWLSQVLMHDPAVNVVGAAVEVLAEVGGTQTLPALHAAKARFAHDDYIGFSIDLAIERIESA